MRRTPHILSCATIFSPFESLAQVAVHSGWEFEDHDFISEALEGDWEKRGEEDFDALRDLANGNASLACGEATERVEDDIDQLTNLEVGVFDALDSADGEAAARCVDTPNSRRHYCFWSSKEDDLICKALAAHGPNWRKLASYLPGRSYEATRCRWKRRVADANATSGLSGDQEGEAKLPLLWTRELDLKLCELICVHEHDWDKLAGVLGEQLDNAPSVEMIERRWALLSNGDSASSAGASLYAEKARRGGSSKGMGKRPWTSEDEARLAALVGENTGQKRQRRSTDWAQVAAHFPGRSEAAAEKHWFRMKNRPQPPREADGSSRKWWTPEDDAQLMTLHDKLEGNWKLMAAHLPHGLAKSRSHFYSLKRKAGEGKYGVNQEGAGRAWSPEEEVKLLNLADKYDLNWERIATELTGRSSQGVHKRWRDLML